MPAPFGITVLISGGGTTLRNLLEKKSAGELDAEFVQVISSNPDADGLQFARNAGIPIEVVDHRRLPGLQEFSEAVFDHCRRRRTDLAVMAGFLRRVAIPDDFENRVINIHPSLIPAFCGQGFYGLRVHDAAIRYGCKISGCTVHFVDNEYDHGPIISQRSVAILAGDSPQRLAARVFEQECLLYPEVINAIANGRVRVNGRQVEVLDRI